MEEPLSALAPLLRVRPVLEDICHLGGDWSSPHGMEPLRWAPFHLVARGSCVVEFAGNKKVELHANDVLLLPHGDAHVVRARMGNGAGPTRVATEYRNAIRIKTTPDAEPETELVCGRLFFEAAADSLVVGILPPVIVLRGDRPRVTQLIQAIHEELESAAWGAAAIAADLGSALLVMLLRAHLTTTETPSAMLRLFLSATARRAALAMLNDPAKEWTLDALADIAAASRATLVRAFRSAAGTTPLDFLTSLRLDLARQRLIKTKDTIAQIAFAVGYQSEATFSRAMLRHYGVRPGALRNDHSG